MRTYFQEICHSIRGFRRAPAFTVTAVAALALGIGGVTAIFSIVNTVLLRPLRIPHADRLVALGTTVDGSLSLEKFVHVRRETEIFDHVLIYQTGAINYSGRDAVQQWHYSRVSEGVFECFGIPVILGRGFSNPELRDGGVALLSQRIWERDFARDPGILGRAISLNGEPHTVIGVAGDISAIREYAPAADVYVPFPVDPATTDNAVLFEVLARLKPGVSLEQARERLQVSTAAFRARFPGDLGPNDRFTVRRFRDDLIGGDRRLLLILSGAVSLVLLVACANVANLLLLHAAGRRRELAIRTAVGASRARIVRQLLTESVLLSCAGAVIGIPLCDAGMRLLLSTNTASLSMIGEHGSQVGIDWRVASFAIVASFGTAILFGLFPSLQLSRVDLQAVLRGGSGHAARNHAGRMIVVGEVALALVLLIGSALLIRSFAALYFVDPGFRTDHVISMNMMVAGRAKPADVIRAGLDRLLSVPGVESAGATCCMPLEQGTFDENFDIVEGPSCPDVGWATVTHGYFETLKIPLKRGRMPLPSDDRRSAPVVWISERMAQQFWPGRDPLGARIVIGRGRSSPAFKEEPIRQIAGIVGDIRSEGLDVKPRAIMYVPQAQLTDAESAFFARLLPVAWVVRTHGESHGLATVIAEQLRQATKLPVTDVSAVQNMVRAQINLQRFTMLLMSVFSAIALLLAAVGIYGLMAYTVEQRRQEIGIRMALGAEAGRMRAMVVRQGMGLAIAGAIVGLASAWALVRLLSSLLFGVGVHDPVVFLAAPLLLITVALAALHGPAARASRVDPIESVRHE